MNNERYMSIEAPTNVAVVDFLSTDTCGGFAVYIRRDGDTVTLTVQQVISDVCAEWREHALVFPVVAPADVDVDVDEDEEGEE